MKNLFSKMHNLYSISKTLRFELCPIGNTKQYFERYILEADERKATAYPFVKKYCDEVHKHFINECLETFNTEPFEKLLEDYYRIISVKDSDSQKLELVKKNLRKTISEIFTENKKYKDLLSEKILSTFVKELYKDNEDALQKINEFDKFSTYFTGYHTSRENIYKNESKHTAIAYRLIDENLPIFKNNLKLYTKFVQTCPDKIQKIKDELNIDTNEFFTDIKQYSKCLTQKDIEQYNLAITGKTLENENKIQGINEYINLYNQQNKDKSKLTKFKVLYKQILSDTNSQSFILDAIETDNNVVNVIKETYNNVQEIIKETDFIQAFKEAANFDWNRILINNDTSLTAFSKAVYEDWSYVSKLVEDNYDQNYKGKTKIGTEKYNTNKEKELKKIKYISLKFIEDNAEAKGKIAEYFLKSIDNLLNNIENAYSNCIEILNKEYEETQKVLQNDKKAIEKIKALLDALKRLQEFVKILIPKTDTDIDLNFYNRLNYETLTEIISVYNKIRNYMTKKPYSIEKFKLNFNCPTLLSGWDLNKEESNLSILFEKNGLYYLGIMNKEDNKVFRKIQEDNCDFYRKIEYKLLPGPNKMLPKVFFSDKGIKKFMPSREILEKYEKGLHKKEANNLEYCHQLIDFFKKSIDIHEDWKNFNFKFRETSSYTDISQFYREILEQGYKISYTNISSKYIDELVESGKLFLFRIYNKDFSEYSKGTPNLHTMYFKALFDEENLKNVVYKLNGEAEVFYRKKSIEAKETHPASVEFDNKKPENQDHKAYFIYPLIKDKRYTLDKFLFHVPITINFKAKGINKFNDYVNEQIKSTDDIHIIGIDRGERNLLYVSIIDLNGNIKEQFSLNKIISEYKGKEYKTDYHALLSEKEKAREEQRKSWGTIENIKELKEGYMSQVVHKLVQTMLKYNGIIVLEDLNKGMKNSRKKVEKSVYDKFETMLVNKLSYIVDKKVNDKYEEGGLLNAYQFTTAELKDSSKYKQNGFIFYIPAWNTSKIDPTTGFVNLFRLQDYTSEEKCKNFVEKIKDIRFNQKENYFEFDIHYTDFTNKDCGIRKDWTLCSFGSRIRTFRDSSQNNNWTNKDIDITEEFKQLFARYNINLSNIKSDILSKSDSKFFKSEGKDGYFGFMYLFKLMLQMRNSKTNSTDSKDDYIISPIKNIKGKFYDSRNEYENLPKDADANGAYNIARKGLMLINRITKTAEGEKIDYNILNSEWLKYVQELDKEQNG